MRVIDVGSSLKEPFLYHPGEDEKAPWLTLSHCWGQARPLTTTLASLQQHCKSIPMSTLPPAFRDAITFTRKLGFQFIWIDSLCIIQDSQKDWAMESAKMHEIYSGATLCIAASSAHGSQDGIFKSGDQFRSYFQSFATIPCLGEKKEDNKQPDGTISFRRCTTDNGMDPNYRLLEDEPLHRRAWVLQESALSPRRLDFSSKELVWSCRSACYTESLPNYNKSSSNSSGKALFSMPIVDVPHSSCPDHKFLPQSPMGWWNSAVIDVMSCGITNRKDLLPAMAGVAAAIKARTKYTYVVGLWKEDLHRGLLWTVLKSRERPKSESVPTWSWASSSSAIDSNPFLERYRSENRAEIVDVTVKTEGDQEFTPVIRASLVIKGNFQLLSSSTWSPPPHYNRLSLSKCYFIDASLVPLDGEEDWIVFALDEDMYTPTLLDSLASRGVICMQIAMFDVSVLAKDKSKLIYEQTVCGLLLEPCEDAVNTFRRIGVVTIPKLSGLADGWPVRTVTLVWLFTSYSFSSIMFAWRSRNVPGGVLER